MNTAAETPTIETPAITILPPAEPDHRGNGKVAQLPKVLRDQVNRMLDDGVPYKAIIEKLEQSTDPPLPYKLLEINISRWKDNGYQRYLRHQEWRDQLRILRENGSDMSELTDGPKFQETLVQIALTEIFRVLQERELKPDSLNYIRLFNALARLNREALGLRKYNDLLAKEQAELKQLDINRELAENEHVAIVDRIDRILEMPRPRRAEGSAARAASSVSSHGVPASAGPFAAEVSPSPRGEGWGEGNRDVQQPAAHDQPSDAVTDTSPIENPKSRIENSPAPSNCPSTPSSPHSPLPSRPCRAETPEPSRLTQVEVLPPHATRNTQHEPPPIENTPPSTPDLRPSEHCLDCGSPLPPVQRHSLRRPDDHCPSCGIRLPEIGLCYQPGFDQCLNCGATQPALLPGGERPRPYCHKCGTRLHNPELPTT